LSAPAAAEFALVVVATLILTLLFHFFVVQKIPMLSLLLNGRRIR